MSTKISFKEKAGYSLGDAGANFVFQTLMFFQVTYFTEVFGITLAAAGWIFLFGRFFDAFTDPLMGIIADRTKTRWGRFRPWLLWSAIPFAIIYWLTFTNPGLEGSGKLVYAWVMYLALMAIYTVNNVPYCALNGVITGDGHERTSLSSFRFFSAMASGLIVSGFTWPLVAKFGDGDDAKGWSVAMGLFAIVAIVFFIITFFTVKERVEPDPKQQTSVKQDIKDLLANRPWTILFLATLGVFVTLVIRGGTLPMYTAYYVDHQSLKDFVGAFGMTVAKGGEMSAWQHVLDLVGYIVKEDGSNVEEVGFGFINLCSQIVTIIGVLLAKPLSMRFGKRLIFTIGLAATAVITFSLYFVPREAVWAVFFQSILWSAAYGPTIPLLWAMIADTADYGEWKNNRRATAFAFAGVVFALKFGLGMGGFIQARALGLLGFIEGKESAPESVAAILKVVSIVPSIFLAVSVGILFFYPITKELNAQIGKELEERRRQRENTADAS